MTVDLLRDHDGRGLAASPVQRSQIPLAWKIIAAIGAPLAALALLVSVLLWSHKDTQDQAIQGGRTVVIDVLCNVDKATISAGQSVIQGSSLTPKQYRWFARHVPDWPPLAQRRAASRAAATGYAESVAAAVARSLKKYGVKPPATVPPQGVDCGVLLKAARANSPPAAK